MARSSPTLERHDTETAGAEREQQLKEIDALVDQCRSRLLGVSNHVLSDATKTDTLSMYERLRGEAENEELRAERLNWMRDNVSFLGAMIAEAAYQTERFEAEIENAKQWLGDGPAEELRSWFFSPSSLEMYRKTWFKNEWQEMKAKGRKLLEDRSAILAKAKAAGLTAKDVPAIADALNAERFANLGTEAKKRDLLDRIDAGIAASTDGNFNALKHMEALLAPHAKGKNRCLHPAKVGAWLKKIAHDPKKYTETVLRGYVAVWQELRGERDALQREYLAAGKPDGCAPLEVNAFLELPVESRRTALAEGRNRLDAATRLAENESDAFERAKQDVRAAIDIEDFDDAERRLKALGADHPYDKDVLSIAAHLAMLRAKHEESTKMEEVQDRTETARRELEEMKTGMPSVVAAHYAYLLENGDADDMAAFSGAMQRRVTRKQEGETNDHDEHVATLEAEEADDAEIVTVAKGAQDDETDTEVHINEGTPPSATFQLLRQRAAKGGPRSAALVIGGLPIDQQMQLVHLNKRMLANKRHLDSVAESDAETALAQAA